MDGYCVCAKAIKFDPVASASWHNCLTAACASGRGIVLANSKLSASAWIISFVAVICADSAVWFGDTAAEISFAIVRAAMAQFLADITGAVVDRPTILETTALGAAWLAGYRAGIYPNQEEFAKTWQRDAQFNPNMADDMRSERYAAWKRAVNATLSV